MTKQHLAADTLSAHINKTQRTESTEHQVNAPNVATAGPVSAVHQRVPTSTVIQLQRLCGNKATQQILRKPGNQPAIASAQHAEIQRYTEGAATVGGKPDQYRISDDEKLLVHQKSQYGSHTLLAEPGHAKIASEQLQAAKSVIRLKEVGSPVIMKNKSGAESTFVRIEPTNVQNTTSGVGDTGMQIWADCGKSARDVIGAGLGTGGGAPKAAYINPGGAATTTPGSGSPDYLKREIILAWLPELEKKKGKPLLDKSKLANLNAKRDTILAKYTAAVTAKKDKATIDDLVADYRRVDDQITELVMAVYNKQLTPKEQAELDQKIGINSWADPGVGEGYTISTGGTPKAGQENNTWNYHWAGVVMKSGGDTVVLENYSVGKPEVQNTDWYYQMYGSAKAAQADPTKKGQTFHEQHRDEHAQHGESPTTMKVKPR